MECPFATSLLRVLLLNFLAFGLWASLLQFLTYNNTFLNWKSPAGLTTDLADQRSDRRFSPAEGTAGGPKPAVRRQAAGLPQTGGAPAGCGV